MTVSPRLKKLVLSVGDIELRITQRHHIKIHASFLAILMLVLRVTLKIQRTFRDVQMERVFQTSVYNPPKWLLPLPKIPPDPQMEALLAEVTQLRQEVAQ